MNLFKSDFKSYKDKDDESILEVSKLLKEGKLSLITGAGVSIPLGLPSWFDLVVTLCENSGNEELSKLVEDKTKKLDLKKISKNFKESFSSEKDYLEAVKNALYKGVELNLMSIHKPMMTALASLFIGKYKGRVKNIITYNFDNLLNWYLTVLGLSVNTEFDKRAMDINEDCSIFHIHGFLPHKDSGIVSGSKTIVFTQKEFDRNIRKRAGIRMQKIKSILTRSTFLSVGVSYDTLLKDITPEIDILKEEWYLTNDKYKFQRESPFGYTIQLNQLDGVDIEVDEEQEDELLEYGIITIKCKDYEVPETIFKITQGARFTI